MQKRFLKFSWGSIIVGVIGPFLFFVGCSAFRVLVDPPKAKLKSVKLSTCDFVGCDLKFEIDIENPNSSDLKIDEVSYQVDLNDKPFAKGNVSDPPELKAKQNTSVLIPLRFEYSKFISSLGEFIQNRTIAYSLKGNVKVGFFNIPFAKKDVVKSL